MLKTLSPSTWRPLTTVRTAGGFVVRRLKLCQENRCVFEAVPECSSYRSGKPVKRRLQSVEFPTPSTPPDTRQFCFLACLGTGRSSSQPWEGSKGLQAAGAVGSRCSQLQRSVRPVGGGTCRGHNQVNLHILGGCRPPTVPRPPVLETSRSSQSGCELELGDCHPRSSVRPQWVRHRKLAKR